MVTVKIKGTACGIHYLAPLSDHSLHKLQAIYSQLGTYTTLRQLYIPIVSRATPKGEGSGDSLYSELLCDKILSHPIISSHDMTFAANMHAH